MTVLVSVVIPAFNAAKTIQRAIASVEAQNMGDFEIILVDDGSRDGTALAASSPSGRLVVLTHEQSQGAAAARNTGINAAQGKYVAFLDADDEWLPGKMKKQIDLLERHDDYVLASCYGAYVDDRGKVIADLFPGRPPVPGPQAWRTLLYYNFISTPTVVVRRSVLARAGGFDTRLPVAEDQDMWIRLAALGSVGFVEERLVNVYVSNDSLSRKHGHENVKYCIGVVMKATERLADRLAPGEANRILGCRLSYFGRAAIGNGDIRKGVPMMLRAISLGYRPVNDTLYLLTAIFRRRWVKAVVSRTLGLLRSLARNSRRARDLAKQLAYRSGAWDLLHRLYNSHTLTVAAFHRVLDDFDPDFPTADPGYTVTARQFGDCLDFFQRHYHVVSLADVLAARRGLRPLPPLALLITFDDGWRDSLTTAAPLLKSRKLPAVVFAAADAVADPGPHWWQDAVHSALRGPVGFADLWCRAGAEEPPPATEPDRLVKLLMRLAPVAEKEPAGLQTLVQPPHQRQMLDGPGLKTLVHDGIEVGSHGSSHLPLSLLPDPKTDLERSRDILTGLLGDVSEGLATLSLPHGRSSEAVITAARAVGFELVFTSAPWLNPTPGGWLTSTTLGRVEVPAHALTDGKGRIAPHRLAGWLINRPHGRATA